MYDNSSSLVVSIITFVKFKYHKNKLYIVNS